MIFILIFTFQFQYFSHPSHDSEGYRELEEHWYRGLCLQNFRIPEFPNMKYEVFCGTENPLTFTEATVYAPLILISILYLPTMIYVI